jgi:hypothetical protein
MTPSRVFAFTARRIFRSPGQGVCEAHCPDAEGIDYQPPILITESMQLAFSVLSLILSQ